MEPRTFHQTDPTAALPGMVPTPSSTDEETNRCSEFQKLVQIHIERVEPEIKPKPGFYSTGRTTGLGFEGVGVFPVGASTSCREMRLSLGGFLVVIV